MQMPMIFFAVLCLFIGIAPQLALHLVSPAIAVCYPLLQLTELPAEYGVILGKISLSGVLLLSAVVIVSLFWRWRLGRAPVTSATTWGCGYQRGTARMQYGASSFSELAVSVFTGIIRQRIDRPVVNGLFPGTARCSDHPSETILERIIEPLFTMIGISFAFLRRLQHGLVHVYMMYIFATLFILMLWAD